MPHLVSTVGVFYGQKAEALRAKVAHRLYCVCHGVSGYDTFVVISECHLSGGTPPVKFCPFCGKSVEGSS